jgi:hypothetical protein
MVGPKGHSTVEPSHERWHVGRGSLDAQTGEGMRGLRDWGNEGERSGRDCLVQEQLAVEDRGEPARGRITLDARNTQAQTLP